MGQFGFKGNKIFLQILTYREGCATPERNFLFAEMKEEEIEIKDVKKDHSDMGADDRGEESSLLENGMEKSPGKDANCQDQDMPMWRLPR